MRIEVKKSLEAIYERDGALDPATLLVEASSADSPLHRCFIWDDSAAAKQYRLHQARQLIRVAVTLIPTINNGPVRQFISVSTLRRGDTGSYLATVDIMSDEQRYRQMRADAVTALIGIEKRFRHIRELNPVFDAIAQVVATQQDEAA